MLEGYKKVRNKIALWIAVPVWAVIIACVAKCAFTPTPPEKPETREHNAAYSCLAKIENDYPGATDKSMVGPQADQRSNGWWDAYTQITMSNSSVSESWHCVLKRKEDDSDWEVITDYPISQEPAYLHTPTN